MVRAVPVVVASLLDMLHRNPHANSLEFGEGRLPEIGWSFPSLVHVNRCSRGCVLIT